jgi:hypothetical protein
VSDENKANNTSRVDEWSKAGRYFMGAYYYTFDTTGCEPIDRILSAVAIAGKCAHHTESWNEHGCVDEIQREAANAAATITRLTKERDEAREARQIGLAALETYREAGKRWLEEKARLESDIERIHAAAERDTAERIAAAARGIEAEIKVDSRAWVPLGGGTVTTLSDWISRCAWRKEPTVHNCQSPAVMSVESREAIEDIVDAAQNLLRKEPKP